MSTQFKMTFVSVGQQTLRVAGREFKLVREPSMWWAAFEGKTLITCTNFLWRTRNAVLEMLDIEVPKRTFASRVKALNPGTIRPKHLSHETNDCTVVALMNCTKLPYETCHGFMRLYADRKDKKGTSPYKIEKAFKVLSTLGFTASLVFGGRQQISETARRYFTINEVLKRYNIGTYYVNISRHCCAIVDGQLVDHTSRGKRTSVETLFKIEPILQ